MTALLSIAIDVTLVATVALLAVALMRRQSAALRHVVLTGAFVAMAMIPLLEASLPTLPVFAWPTVSPAVASTLEMTSAVVTGQPEPGAGVVETSSFSWVALLTIVWALGVVTVTGKLLRGFVYLARIESGSHVIENGRWRDHADDVAQRLSLRRRVTILRSPDPALLMTYGVRHPKLVVPAEADSWSDERLQIVLTHELAHVRRHDSTTMLLAALVCALHWFNPLVWLCAARLRRESECACDDAVLRQGVDATRYAALLLSVARGTLGRRAWVAAPAIAHPSTLERRVAAMLQHSRNRAPVSRLAKALVAIATAAIVMPMAAAGIAPAAGTAPAVTIGSDVSLQPVQARGGDVTPVEPDSNRASAHVRTPQTAAMPARGASPSLPSPVRVTENANTPAPAAAPMAAGGAQGTGNISGTAVDASGGVLPGVTVRLFDPGRGFEVRTVVTDSNGRFLLRDILAGQYELTLTLPGFAMVHTTLALTPDATVSRQLMLPIGTVEETITAGCSARAGAGASGAMLTRVGALWARGLDAFMPTLAAQEPVRFPVRVGGNIQPPRKVKDVRPVCPAASVPATGATVKLTGRIGIDGLLNDLTPVSSAPDVEPPGEVTQSAIDAVRQWAFTPTLLNGQMVETNINIRITYK